MIIGPQSAVGFFVALREVIYPGLAPVDYPFWWAYISVAIFYTGCMFYDEIPEEKREIFSKQNKMSTTQILLIHASFLALLLLYFQVGSLLVKYLPTWMTEGHNLGDAYSSVSDFLFFFGGVLLFVGERIWLTSRMTEPDCPRT